MFYFSCLIWFIYIYICVCVWRVCCFPVLYVLIVCCAPVWPVEVGYVFCEAQPSILSYACHFSSGDVGDDLVSQHEIPIGVIPMSSSYHWSIDPLTQWIAPRECMALFPLLTWLCQGCPPAANSRKMPNPRMRWRKTYGKTRRTSLNLRDKTFNKNTVSHRSSRIVPKPNDSKNWPSLSSSMSPSQPVPNMSLDAAPPTCQHAPRMHMDEAVDEYPWIEQANPLN